MDDDGTVLVDNWSVFATLADLSSRVDILETEVGNEFIGLIATVAGMSNQVESLVNRANLHDQEIEDLKTRVDAVSSGALHYMGTYNSFSALVAAVTTPLAGDVYNITTAGGSDSKGTPIKAGDNVAAYYEGSNLRWDVLGGTTDLSNYYTKAEINGTIANYDTSTQVDSKISTALGSYYTKSDLNDALSGMLIDG